MVSFISILLLLALLSFVIQLSLLKSNLPVIILLMMVSVGIYLAYPFAIEQSYSKFQEMLTKQEIVSNFLVVQIVECIAGVLLSIFLIRMFYNEPVISVFRYLNYFPGIIILPAFFYMESFIFLNIPGVSFKLLALLIALFVPAFIFGFIKLIRYFIPEYDLRLELKFVLHIIQLLVAIIVSVKLFRLPVKSAITDIPLMQLAVLFFLLIGTGIVGFVLYNRKIRKLLSEKNN